MTELHDDVATPCARAGTRSVRGALFHLGFRNHAWEHGAAHVMIQSSLSSGSTDAVNGQH